MEKRARRLANEVVDTRSLDECHIPIVASPCAGHFHETRDRSAGYGRTASVRRFRTSSSSRLTRGGLAERLGEETGCGEGTRSLAGINSRRLAIFRHSRTMIGLGGGVYVVFSKSIHPHNWACASCVGRGVQGRKCVESPFDSFHLMNDEFSWEGNKVENNLRKS